MEIKPRNSETIWKVGERKKLNDFGKHFLYEFPSNNNMNVCECTNSKYTHTHFSHWVNEQRETFGW